MQDGLPAAGEGARSDRISSADSRLRQVLPVLVIKWLEQDVAVQ